MTGCGHVYLPNDQGGVELSTAWCGECARGLIAIREGLAKQLLLECEAHVRTQEWLDEFQGQAAQGQADMLVTKTGVTAVTGLICAIYAWQRWCLVHSMMEAAVTAFMRTQGLRR